jgi:large subunit ribosomal protein L35
MADSGLETEKRVIYFSEEMQPMPKLKTNRGAAKRLKATGSGKIKHYKAYASHLLTSKTTKRKRNLRHSELVSPRDAKNMKRLLPYL